MHANICNCNWLLNCLFPLICRPHKSQPVIFGTLTRNRDRSPKLNLRDKNPVGGVERRTRFSLWICPLFPVVYFHCHLFYFICFPFTAVVLIQALSRLPPISPSAAPSPAFLSASTPFSIFTSTRIDCDLSLSLTTVLDLDINTSTSISHTHGCPHRFPNGQYHHPLFPAPFSLLSLYYWLFIYFFCISIISASLFASLLFPNTSCYPPEYTFKFGLNTSPAGFIQSLSHPIACSLPADAPTPEHKTPTHLGFSHRQILRCALSRWRSNMKCSRSSGAEASVWFTRHAREQRETSSLSNWYGSSRSHIQPWHKYSNNI